MRTLNSFFTFNHYNNFHDEPVLVSLDVQIVRIILFPGII